MNFKIIEAEQRSPEWLRARAGRITGSKADVILAQGKAGKESVQRRDYRMQLLAERISGEAQENFYMNADMQRGIDLEPMAFATYEARTGTLVRRTGFIMHDDLMAGCSLDGDVNEFSGIVELKCPKMATHLGYLGDHDALRAAYMPQIQHNLWITGATFCDIVSFDDRLPDKLRMLRVRVERRDANIKAYEFEALRFLGEVDQLYRSIMEAA